MNFHVVIAMHNVAPWIAENIRMLAAQDDEDFRCTLIDDLSADDTVEHTTRAIGGDGRFTLVANAQRRYKARNVCDAIAMAGAKDDEVIVIDGDDGLADRHGLSHVRERYANEDCWMTYGGCVDAHRRRSDVSYPYAARTIRQNGYRKHRWYASHLKTSGMGCGRIRPDAFAISRAEYEAALRRAVLTARFRAWHHWRKIRLDDLHDPSGRFIRRVDDKALTFPMLEMAADRAVFVERVLYVYNQDPTRISASIYGAHGKKWPGRLVRDVIRHKPPYERLDRLAPTAGANAPTENEAAQACLSRFPATLG